MFLFRGSTGPYDSTRAWWVVHASASLDDFVSRPDKEGLTTRQELHEYMQALRWMFLFPDSTRAWRLDKRSLMSTVHVSASLDVFVSRPDKGLTTRQELDKSLMSTVVHASASLDDFVSRLDKSFLMSTVYMRALRWMFLFPDSTRAWRLDKSLISTVHASASLDVFVSRLDKGLTTRQELDKYSICERFVGWFCFPTRQGGLDDSTRAWWVATCERFVGWFCFATRQGLDDSTRAWWVYASASLDVFVSRLDKGLTTRQELDEYMRALCWMILFPDSTRAWRLSSHGSSSNRPAPPRFQLPLVPLHRFLLPQFPLHRFLLPQFRRLRSQLPRFRLLQFHCPRSHGSGSDCSRFPWRFRIVEALSSCV
jgi:hypothetical protein